MVSLNPNLNFKKSKIATLKISRNNKIIKTKCISQSKFLHYKKMKYSKSRDV